MPSHYGLSLSGSDNFSPQFGSSGNNPDGDREDLVKYRRDQRSDLMSGKSASSCSLSCLSPDGRAVHSIDMLPSDSSSHHALYSSPNVASRVSIVTHFLPLKKTRTERSPSSPSKNSNIEVVQTVLPNYIVDALQIDTPLGLVCVDNDAGDVSRSRKIGGKRVHYLPMLCLYTRASAFLLKISYSIQNDENNQYGTVESVIEPFESHLLGAPPSTTILKIRPAPQRHHHPGNNCNILCPPGAMAMLTSEHTLVLYHGIEEEEGEEKNAEVTTPLSFGVEELQSETDTVTDFCFFSSVPNAPGSNTNHEAAWVSNPSLLASFTVLLLKQSGEINAACPIVFDGTLVPQSWVLDTMRDLERETEQCQFLMTSQNCSARFRQCKAAQQFLIDAFGSNLSSGEYQFYVTARTLMGSVRSSTLWPVQLQGPIIRGNDAYTEEEEGGTSTTAVTIEPFLSRTQITNQLISLDGIVVGRTNNRLDVAVLPVGMIFPRFAYEGESDQLELNNALDGSGGVVERVGFDVPNENSDSSGTIVALVCDPIYDGMVHYATTQGVFTITTNAVPVAAEKIQAQVTGKGEGNATIKTSAWSCLEVSSSSSSPASSLSGVVVSSDAHLGHVLVARLSNGTMEDVNLTTTQYMHESLSLAFTSSSQEDASNAHFSKETLEANEALKAMESTKPFHELAEPLMKEIVTGLSSMGRIVGASTLPKDSTPATLAVLLATKERCESQVILPMKELNQLTEQRSKDIKGTIKYQIAQLSNVKEMIKALKSRLAETVEKKAVIEANADSLADRSASVLLASRDLLPSLTQAEIEYFTQLKRLETSCTKWEDQVKQMENKVGKFVDIPADSKLICNAHLNEEQLKMCQNLLQGQNQMLKRSNNRIKDMQSTMQSLAI